MNFLSNIPRPAKGPATAEDEEKKEEEDQKAVDEAGDKEKEEATEIQDTEHASKRSAAREDEQPKKKMKPATLAEGKSNFGWETLAYEVPAKKRLRQANSGDA